MTGHIPDWDPGAHLAVDQRKAQMLDIQRRCPIAYTEARGGQWTVTNYRDLVHVASDAETFSSGKAPRFGRRLLPLEVDPPLHGIFRKLLQRFWLPSRMRALEPKIRRIAEALIRPLVARGEADLSREFAYPFPVLGLCAILNIPDDRWQDIKIWAEESLGAESGDEAERDRARQAHEKLMAHARDIVADRRLHPQSLDEDIATALLTLEVEGAPIEDELVAAVLRLLISAGHNSTTNALGNILLYMGGNADAQARMRSDQAQIPLAIEELLRFESPVQEMPRYATRDVELKGRSIQAGDRLGLFWGAGNLDGAIFDEPEKCILDRRPNRHLAFGYGIHSCLGAPLARMELRVALETLLSATSSFSLAGEVVRKPYHHMGVARLPATLIAVAAST